MYVLLVQYIILISTKKKFHWQHPQLVVRAEFVPTLE